LKSSVSSSDQPNDNVDRFFFNQKQLSEHSSSSLKAASSSLNLLHGLPETILSSSMPTASSTSSFNDSIPLGAKCIPGIFLLGVVRESGFALIRTRIFFSSSSSSNSPWPGHSWLVIRQSTEYQTMQDENPRKTDQTPQVRISIQQIWEFSGVYSTGSITYSTTRRIS